MKSALRLPVLLLGLITSFASQADQFALPYGWTGGNGSSGQCLLSRGSVLLPSFGTCPGAGAGNGTVTSVAETVPGFLAITGSPITTNGTLAITGATGQATHQVVGTGTTGTVALFALTTADLPTLAAGSNGLVASATTDTTNAANISSGALPAGRMPALTGDVTSTVGTVATTVAKVNGSTPGGACTNQAVTSLSSSAVPTCTTLTSAYVDTSIAKTGTDVNTSNQVTATHLAAALPINQGGSGTTSTLTGLVRGSASSMTAAEMSGDCTTSGSNAITCTKSSGVALAASATTDTTNATNITSGTLAATIGGTGQTTITLGDLLYGSASNVLGKLAGNTTTTKQFLSQTGNGTVSAAPAWGALAAADVQGLAPVWTQNQEISDAEPRYILTETDQGADLKKWDLDLNSGVTCLRTRTDADGAGQNAFCATRGTTTALTNISLGYATSGTYSFPFTGLATFGGALTVGGTVTFGSTYTVTTGGTATLLRVLLNTGVYIAGTKFTTSGCSVSASTGGATAGVFTLGANSCSAVVTFGTGTLAAGNGWTCQAHDRTAPTILIGGESSSTTSTATFTIPAGAGATDVISFSCMAY